MVVDIPIQYSVQLLILHPHVPQALNFCVFFPHLGYGQGSRYVILGDNNNGKIWQRVRTGRPRCTRLKKNKGKERRGTTLGYGERHVESGLLAEGILER